MSSDSCRVSLLQVPPVCQCMRRVSPCGEGTVRVVSGLQPRWTSGAHDELAQKQRSLPCRLRSPVRVHLSCSQLLLTQLVLCGSAGKHTHKQPDKMSLSFYVDLECLLTRKKEDGFEVSLDQKESEVYMCLLDGYTRTNTITCSQMTFDSVCMSRSLYTWMLLFTVFNPKYCTGRIVCSSSSLYIMFILKYCRYWCINLYWRGNLSVLAVC